ncbi:MAG: copper homeostasis protein CutC [Lachnospiraceae bacterium]|nr:copper homeostasis protein CutC [Lachnospiraceae bacterium]
MLLEVCTGGYEDALAAYQGRADRIELNQALPLGGLSPSILVLTMIRETIPTLQVASMVRPRAGGFCYSEEEYKVMLAECNALLRAGSHGIVFGILNSDCTINVERSKRIIDLIKTGGREVIFHRAFDNCKDLNTAMETLIALGVDRVLTSGGKSTAWEGKEMLCKLQKDYGAKIQILAGSGVNAGNIKALVDYTGLQQFHSSCKAWKEDPTTVQNVSYAIPGAPEDFMYDMVAIEKVRELKQLLS